MPLTQIIIVSVAAQASLNKHSPQNPENSFLRYMYRLLNVNRKIFRTSLCASPPYKPVPNILRYTFNNLFIMYLLNSYFMTDNASIYNIQDHPAIHFAIVNVKTIISSAIAGYSCAKR